VRAAPMKDCGPTGKSSLHWSSAKSASVTSACMLCCTTIWGVYKEHADGTPIYNWQYIDKLYDYLLRIGLKPFVELAFMPHNLSSGGKTVFWVAR
jgi:Glycosyl hydrolases family 39